MITCKAAADRLKVSTQRVRLLCNTGRIKGAVKVGRDWMIPPNFSVTNAKNGRPRKVIAL
jgi:hypothetical protein